MQYYVINDTEAGPIGTLAIRQNNGIKSKINTATQQAIESYHDCTVINLIETSPLYYSFDCDNEHIDSGKIQLIPVANYTI